jgi:tetratricopeptide (TPR) repeat protein
VSGKSFARVWGAPFIQRYIPVTYTLWLAIALMAKRTATGELDPTLFHAVNLVLHLLNTGLVFLLLRRLIPRASDLICAIGALFFALHPLQVESVAWCTSIQDLLSGTFSLTAINFYLIFLERDKPSLGRNAFYLAAFSSFALALLSRASAVTLPPILGALGVLLYGRSIRRSFFELLPWLLAALPVILLTKGEMPDSALLFQSPYWARPGVALDALAFYISKLLYPLKLGPDYGRNPGYVIEQGYLWWTWVLPVATALLLGWAGGKRIRGNGYLAGYSIFVLGLLPTLGFISYDCQYMTTVADRYAYLSLTGVSVLVCFVLLHWNGKATLTACAALLLFLGTQARAQAWVWKDTATLFAHAYEIDPSPRPTRLNYARSLFEAGQFKAAAEILKRALEARPDDPKLHNDYAIALAEQGQRLEAEVHFLRSLELKPSQETYSNLAQFYNRIGRPELARTYFTPGQSLGPPAN